MTTTHTSDELLRLSQQKWDWMRDRDVDALGALIHDDARFVHMGATFTKTEELDVLRTGYIQNKHIEIHDASVRTIDTTAVVLNRVTLTAVVDGNEVTNPFAVTEVYVDGQTGWQLLNLSFTRLLTPTT